MNPLRIAQTAPDKAAVVMAEGGETLTYGALAEQVSRLSSLFHGLGLRRGDHMALLMENCPDFLCVCWAATLSGLYYTPISTHLLVDDVGYILKDCGAKVLITTPRLAPVAAAAAAVAGTRHRYCRGGGSGLSDLEAALAGVAPAEPPTDGEGSDMLYSSGTTGRPKGVKRPLPAPGAGSGRLGQVRQDMFRIDGQTRLLSPAPLYHAAPLRLSMATLRAGGLVVLLAAFDPERCLAAIDAHRLTHAQFVPTMFGRLLGLPDAVKSRYDHRSLTLAIHAAAPCPVAIKERMIAWWGPILFEYYGGTEGNGMCALGSEEWLLHKGSVGRAKLGRLRILDDDGTELPTGVAGTVYFEGGPTFEYHNDPEKTLGSRTRHGWTTLGDVGYLDDEGYLYLVDRKFFTIVSGGVNIYPQEIEDLLVAHDAVADAAVFGVPNDDFGEEVKAVVELRPDVAAGSALAEDLIAFCQARLGKTKTPRSIDFSSALPRTPTGKLNKKPLRDAYWADRASRIV